VRVNPQIPREIRNFSAPVLRRIAYASAVSAASSSSSRVNGGHVNGSGGGSVFRCFSQLLLLSLGPEICQQLPWAMAYLQAAAAAAEQQQQHLLHSSL
jgi:hypothetical protein